MNAPRRVPSERLWMGALLRAITKVPAGEKLNIRELRDPLGLTQGETVAAIELLIDEGRLDRATLRPPQQAAAQSGGRPASNEGEPSKPLFDALMAEAKRRGLSVQALSLAVWGNKARVYQLKSAAIVRQATAEKIRAWIAQSRSRKTEGASRTAREAPSATESTVADAGDRSEVLEPGVRTEGHAPLAEPVRECSPPARAQRSEAAAVLAAARRAPLRAPVPLRKDRVDPKRASPLPTFLKPAEVTWCAQCEQRVSGAHAGQCLSTWCSLKESAA